MVTHPFDPDDDFPFDGPLEASRGTAPPDPPDRPSGDPPGGVPDDEPEGADWERVREAAWRVGQRVRRHERVLHTRISQELAGELRRAADDLRVPVSNLVRNVLEEAFGAVERVSDEVGGFLEEVLSDTDATRSDLRRLRRQVRRFARRGRRRARRGLAAEDAFEDDAYAEPGETAAPGREAPATAPAAAAPDAGAREPVSREDRVETVLREAGARDQVFRPRGAELPFAEVLGWQPLLLNAPAPCACGERQLAAGEEAFVAVTERGLSRTFLCRTCMRARGAA